MDALNGYTKEELYRLSDMGILPSRLGVGERHDTSAKYLNCVVDIGEDGVGMIIDKDGAYEFKLGNQ